MELAYLLIAVVLIILLTTRFRVHPFIALLIISIGYGFIAGMPYETIVNAINGGFGNTLGKVGLIIFLGVIIGAFLEQTGGAFAIAEKVLSIIGKKRVTAAMGIIGYVVSIPVFADSGFLLLHPLNKSLSKGAKLSLAGTAVALGLGLLASHTLVPPTPGPIAAAGIIGADLGLVIGLGIPVSLVALFMAILFARKYASRTYIDPQGETKEEPKTVEVNQRPGALRSSIPILVPILLIILKSVLNPAGSEDKSELMAIIAFIGEPVIALLIGVFLCLLLPRKITYEMLSSSGWVGKAVKDAASIVLITGAGGIFGQILQDSGIATTLGATLSTWNIGILLPFVLAAALKTAQGSSTVALITTASILMPMMATLGFETDVQKALVVLSIGAGSSVISHANDSFFWVVTQLSGMKVNHGYRLFSLGTFVLGSSAALTVFLLYQFIG
ncbi:GntP family permease [Lentiprolixibacter aurantiacus]|uniref:Gluconate:H+ symporter n=1 Tax=Lentiprolixibacter aurantiacus TaxID=2993939 RepID=A0AAE3MJF4_9FLAO|nr:gluconate:H+ symporter [Lentiprolixibacter aurantiacus]MCX2718416.1 gluconate:H+ symporter [Lentiprolixibacter aurantiacus]